MRRPVDGVRTLVVLAASLLVACGDDSPYTKVRDATVEQVSGRWIRFGGLSLVPATRSLLSESPPDQAYSLELRPDLSCQVGSKLGAFLADCTSASTASAHDNPICSWALESGVETQELTIVAEATDGKWLPMKLIVERDPDDMELILEGVCSSGSKYILVRPHLVGTSNVR